MEITILYHWELSSAGENRSINLISFYTKFIAIRASAKLHPVQFEQPLDISSILFLFRSSRSFRSGGLEFGKGIQKSTAHAHQDKEPCFLANFRIEEPVSQKCDGNLVEAANRHVGRWSGGVHTIQGSKVEEKAHQTGKKVHEEIIGRV